MDMDGSGGMGTTIDLLLANNVILNIDPPSAASDRFGTITWYHLGITYPLTTHDVLIAQKMILGIITC